jgi:hypothetical protein
VDIIPQPLRNWETAKVFFDWDPTGNLMGKIAHKFGLKYGFQGLVYPFRSASGRQVKDIKVSTDNREIFKFLGFNYDRYLEGFDTLEDIFEWIISSEFFNPVHFQMENLSAIDRKRNKKRATFQEFLTYVGSHSELSTWDKEKFVFMKDKDTYHELIETEFPETNLKKVIKTLKLQDEKVILAGKLFNGRFVMEVTGLQGKELGQIISKWKDYLTCKSGLSYTNAILSSSDIENEFLEFYKQIK